MSIRHDWTLSELTTLYQQPLLDLIYQAASEHRAHHDPHKIQMCKLLSIKTGGCPEDCSYCPQAARYHTGVKAERMLDIETVKQSASEAKSRGCSRFCMTAAWRHVRDGKQFDQLLDLVKEVKDMGLEVCCSLGMLNPQQAEKLRDSGLYAYNHNLDTSPEHYKRIISTRNYEDRLNTLENVRNSGLTVCCGGIIGMGESLEDRMGLLKQLASLPEHPESVPINSLIAVPGTPLEGQKSINIWDIIRMVAVTRLALPLSIIRLSAGRKDRSQLEQAILFLVGANSIHTGEKLLTQETLGYDADEELMNLLGLEPMEAHELALNC